MADSNSKIVAPFQRKAAEIINTSATADDCERNIAQALSEARKQGLLEAAEILQPAIERESQQETEADAMDSDAANWHKRRRELLEQQQEAIRSRISEEQEDKNSSNHEHDA